MIWIRNANCTRTRIKGHWYKVVTKINLPLNIISVQMQAETSWPIDKLANTFWWFRYWESLGRDGGETNMVSCDIILCIQISHCDLTTKECSAFHNVHWKQKSHLCKCSNTEDCVGGCDTVKTAWNWVPVMQLWNQTILIHV